MSAADQLQRNGKAASAAAPLHEIPQATEDVVPPAPTNVSNSVDWQAVQALQRTILEAFEQLDAVTAQQPGAALATAAMPERAPVLGSAIGSAVAAPSRLLARILKTALALAAAFIIGLVPLRHLLMLSSIDAYVNAPLDTMTAPVAGRLVGGVAVGAPVSRGEHLAFVVAGRDGATHAIVSPSDGKIWEIFAHPDDKVAEGQPLFRIVGCSVASVTTTVSEWVYDRLAPGMSARFNFYGSTDYYHGTVANLIGHASPADGFASNLSGLAGDSYHVVVSVPGLGALTDCAVGRRGKVIFGLSGARR